MAFTVVGIHKQECLTEERAEKQLQSLERQRHNMEREGYMDHTLSAYRVGTAVITTRLESADPHMIEILYRMEAEVTDMFVSTGIKRRKTATVDGYDDPLFDEEDY